MRVHSQFVFFSVLIRVHSRLVFAPLREILSRNSHKMEALWKK